MRKGDLLGIISRGDELISVEKYLKHGSLTDSSWITIFPPYNVIETIDISPHKLVVSFRERLSEKDWKQAKRLEQFHYRGKGLEKIVGRRTVLVAEEQLRGIIAYGVISSTVPLAKPRLREIERRRMLLLCLK